MYVVDIHELLNNHVQLMIVMRTSHKNSQAPRFFWVESPQIYFSFLTMKFKDGNFYFFWRWSNNKKVVLLSSFLYGLEWVLKVNTAWFSHTQLSFLYLIQNKCKIILPIENQNWKRVEFRKTYWNMNLFHFIIKTNFTIYFIKQM